MRGFSALIFATIALTPQAALACATCFGNPESPQTQAANMAILFMLGVVGCVLALLSTLFLSLVSRAKRLAPAEQPWDEKESAHE